VVSITFGRDASEAVIVYSATDAKNRFGEVLDYIDKGAVQVRKNNRPFAYIMSAEEYAIARPVLARERIRRLIAAKDQTCLDLLTDYANGKRSRNAMVLDLELDNYGDLLNALSMAGLKAPRIPKDRAKTMALDFRASLRSKAIRLVLPDWGALIALARAGKLDLLSCFHPNIRFLTTDVVLHQVRRRVDLESGDAIGAFLTKHKARLEVGETTFAGLMKASGSDAAIELPWDFAELSVYSYMPTVPESPPGEATIAVFEDDWFLSHDIRVPRHFTWISTSAFLDAVEKSEQGHSESHPMSAPKRKRH
jgi:prevent-host-death family protein